MPTQISLLECLLEERFLEGFREWVKWECRAEALYQEWAEGFQGGWAEGFQEEWAAEDKLQGYKAGA